MDYYKEEIRKLELQRKNLKDQYNTLDDDIDITKTTSYIPTPTLPYSPTENETLQEYYPKLKIYRKINYEVSTKSHITPPQRCMVDS